MSPAVIRILQLPALEAAPLVLGMEFSYGGAAGIIVEAEAYNEDDEASHCFGGPRGRNTPMFLPGGHLYVYRSYGVHWCLNLVTGANGRGEAVLVRALEPTAGIDAMRTRRENAPDQRLCAGPGNLTRALGVDDSLNEAKLGGAAVLTLGKSGKLPIVSGPRIGLTRALEKPWRFRVEGSRFVSR